MSDEEYLPRRMIIQEIGLRNDPDPAWRSDFEEPVLCSLCGDPIPEAEECEYRNKIYCKECADYQEYIYE